MRLGVVASRLGIITSMHHEHTPQISIMNETCITIQACIMIQACITSMHHRHKSQPCITKRIMHGKNYMARITWQGYVASINHKHKLQTQITDIHDKRAWVAPAVSGWVLGLAKKPTTLRPNFWRRARERQSERHTRDCLPACCSALRLSQQREFVQHSLSPLRSFLSFDISTTHTHTLSLSLHQRFTPTTTKT